MKVLSGLTLNEIEQITQEFGASAYRAKQIHHWIYTKSVSSFDEMTDLAKDFRQALKENFAHGVTIYEAIGGYSGQTKYVFESIVLTYEIEEYRKIVRKQDPNAFISFTSIKGIDGRYNKKVIG